jgi:hypothetical protein
MTTLIKRKVAILSLLLAATLMSRAQEGSLVFKYMKHGVKTIHLSRTERMDYIYDDGVIIEKQDLSLDGTVERHCFYKEIGKIDSVVYYEIYEDTTYLSRDYHHYTYEGSRIKTIKVTQGVEGGQITLDSFLYKPNGLVDQMYHFENKIESILGTERTTELLLQETIKYEYDDSLVLTRAYSKGDLNGQKLIQEYDNNGLLIKTIEYLGYTRKGCIVGEDQQYCHTSYSYNLLGLPLREVHKYTLLKPNGKIKNNGRVSFKKRKYQYYR